MSFHHNLSHWIITLFIVAHCQAHPSGLHVDSNVGLPNGASGYLPCPDPAAIYPCVCRVDSELVMDIDCSKVESENELRFILNKPLPFKNFHKLSIEGNSNITSLTAGSLGQLTFEEILMDEANLPTIGPETFLGSAATLRKLMIWRSNLSSFPFEELPQYEVLEVFSLWTNSFTSFPWLESPTIWHINLIQNYIPVIPSNAFDHLPNIQEFLMETSQINELQPGSFTGMENLNYVILYNNNLTYIPKDAFEFGSNDSLLVLAGNQISDVSRNAFRGIPKSFHIDDNQLTEFREEVWQPVMEGVSYFYATENPFLCGCDIAWLILNPSYMAKLTGNERCSDGELLSDLDPAIYELLC